MVAHMLSVGSLFALRFRKCDHIEEKSVLRTVEDHTTQEEEKSVLRTVEDHTTQEEVFESENGE